MIDPVIAALIEKVAQLTFRTETLERANDHNALQARQRFETLEQELEALRGRRSDDR